LWLVLGALGCTSEAAEVPVMRPGRALMALRLEGLSLLPAAAIAPPPSEPAPAFSRLASPARGYSVGPTNAGSLVDATALPLDHPSLRIRPATLTRQAYFGAPALVAMLVRAAERVAREHPGSTLWAGDLSLFQGGALAPHSSHTSGRDVDLSFYVSWPGERQHEPADGPEMHPVDAGGQVGGTALRFDTARNWSLIQAFLEDPGATPQWIFVASHLREHLLDYARKVADPSLVARAQRVLAQPRDSSPHADHFHVRLYCGLADRLQGCLDAPPWHPWAPRYEEALGAWLDGLLPFLAEPRLPETREAIVHIVRMNATAAVPHLERLLASRPGPELARLTEDAIDFLRGRRTPTGWRRWRALDGPP